MSAASFKAELRRNVLIYPYWNVNASDAQEIGLVDEVLIYPYWNVNIVFCHLSSTCSSFNLSILECKYRPPLIIVDCYF